MLSGEATNTNLIVFGVTHPELNSTIYHTVIEHDYYYTTNAVDL
jgi:hypothetical protein